MEKNKIALIPAFEPDEKIINITDELYNNGYHIIIVNDGSAPSYNIFFNQCKNKAHIISYAKNKGKGYALKEGLKYIKNNYNDAHLVVTLDCDGQHSIKDVNKICDFLGSKKDTIIIGKRIRNSNTPLRSKLGNSITSFIYKIVTGSRIYDTQTGLRAFSVSLIDYMISIDGNRYEYELNVLLNSKKNNIKIEEVTIETIYFSKNSNSHFKTFLDSFIIYKEIIKFSISSILSFVVDYLFYIIFSIVFKNITLSNIFARVISASFNYCINKNIVFKSKKNTILSFLEYACLAITILIFNTILLNFFINVIHLNIYISKIFTEILLFLFSMTIQKRLIFKRDERSID